MANQIVGIQKRVSNFIDIYNEEGDDAYDDQARAFFNGDGPAIRFEDCRIKDNFSQANLIHILLSSMEIRRCEITDNYALTVTHGVTLISSRLYV